MLPIPLLVFTFLSCTLGRALPAPASTPPDQILIDGYSPYEFGYEFGDGLGLNQYRKEKADENGLVQGSYGYVDPDGLYRSVEYKADSNGFQAIVKSNEPGLANQNSADANFIVEPPPPEVLLKNAALQDSVLLESV